MLRKRDLPVCVPLPGIKFDIEKMKQEYKALDHMFRNLFEENEGITAVSYTHLTLPTIYSV